MFFDLELIFSIFGLGLVGKYVHFTAWVIAALMLSVDS